MNRNTPVAYILMTYHCLVAAIACGLITSTVLIVTIRLISGMSG